MVKGMGKILEVDRINTFYGLSHILFDVSFSVNRGEVVALLGRNGAGKTTTFRSIMGLTPPKTGCIIFEGRDIVGKPPYSIAKLGVGYVPEDRRIFPDLTVLDNLIIGEKKPPQDDEKGVHFTIEKIFSLFPLLEKLSNRRAGYLSGGEQQMLTIARTLMGNPKLLLLDEPTEGLAPLIVMNIGELIQELKNSGVTILLAEQNVGFVLNLADRVYILDDGQIVYEGAATDLKQDMETMKKYLAV